MNKEMKTLSFDKGFEEKITIGKQYYFGQLWDGNGDCNELLDECSVSPNNEDIVEFKIIERNENPLNTVVKVTDIY